MVKLTLEDGGKGTTSSPLRREKEKGRGNINNPQRIKSACLKEKNSFFIL